MADVTLTATSLNFHDYGGGYNSHDTEEDIKDNQLSGGQNIDILPNTAIAKRQGHTLYGNVIGTTTGILGLVVHAPAGGTAEFLSVYDTGVYRDVAGVWTLLTGGATLTTNLKVDSAHFPLTAKTYITNGTDSVQVYTSGSTIASDASFKKGKYITHYKNRLITANVTSQADYVWYTDLGVDTFSANNYIRVEGEVTGLEVIYDYLLIFTKRKIYAIRNFTFNGVAAGPEAVVPLRTEFGAIYDRTIAKVGTLIYFIGQSSEGVAAVYACDGQNITQRPISEPITPDFSGLAPAQLATSCAGSWGAFYRCSVAPSGATTNTREYLWDTVQKRWLPPYTNEVGGFSCYATIETSGQLDLYAGTQTLGQVYKLNQVDYDERPEETFVTVGAYDGPIDANPAKREAQSFQLHNYTTSDEVTINSLWLRLKKNAGTTTNLTIRIETNNNGKPSGTLADAQASATITAFSTTSYTYKEAAFTNVTLLGDTTYWIVAQHATEGSGTSQYYWSGHATGTYTYGNEAAYDSGVTSSVDTFNPDASPESTSVDGIVFKNVAAGDTFANMRAFTTGSFGDNTLTMIPNLLAGTTTNTYTEMGRAIILFDTSSLPADASISSAVLQIYVSFTVNGLSQSFVVGASNPASNTALDSTDYAVGDFGSTAFSTAASIDTLTTSAYNSISLNASGISAIDVAGISKFAIRLSADFNNSAPSWASGAQSAIVISTADSSNKPRLVVTYTSATGVATWTATAATDQNFIVHTQGAYDAFADTKAFALAPQGQRAHLRDLIATTDAPGDYTIQIGVNDGVFDGYNYANINLGSNNPIYGSTFTLGTSTLGGQSRAETRVRFRASRSERLKVRYRNDKANQPFTAYGFRTRHEIMPRLG